MPPPSTTRLQFRPYSLDDVEDVYRLFADPYAQRFYPQSTDREAAKGWIGWNLRNYEEHGFGLFAIELRDTGEFVGDCGVTMQPVEGRRRHEVGYHVVAPFRRRGLATEAAIVCRDWALDDLNVPFICSIVHVENIASQRVAERVHENRRSLVQREKPCLLYFTERAGP